MALRRKQPPAAPAPCACAERVAELEAAVAALARHAARNGAAANVYELPGNRVIRNEADAAAIRAAARQGQR
jgi:hypothetical protein